MAKFDPLKEFVTEVIGMVKGGQFDSYLGEFDEAVTDRIAAHNDENEKKSAKTAAPATRTVPQPTRKSAASSFVPDVNGTYVVADGVKNIAGKKVKFLRFRKDDTTKAVVEMLEDAPGAPKSKKVVVLVSALSKKSAGSGRRVVKKKGK